MPFTLTFAPTAVCCQVCSSDLAEAPVFVGAAVVTLYTHVKFKVLAGGIPPPWCWRRLQVC